MHNGKPGQKNRSVVQKLSWLNTLRGYGNPNDPFFSDLIEVAAYSGNEKLFENLEKVLTYEAIPRIAAPFGTGPPATFPSGLEAEKPGIFIGTILYGDRHGANLLIPVESFALHVLIAGISGSGKSFLIKLILPQLIEKGITVKIFDSENEYKSLLNVVEPGRIYIIDAKNDRDNFLEPPPGVSPSEWISKLLNLLREVFYLRDGTINLLRNLLNDLLNSRGIYNGNDNYPTIHDLVNMLDNIQFKPGSRYSGYHESLTNRFKGLQENLGDTLACKKGFDLTNEPGKIIVYRTASLSDDIRNFYINLKMLKEAMYREKLPPQGLRTIFLIEEAHKLYNERIARRNDLGEPMIFSSSRTFRKRGIGCVYSDQVPSVLPAALSANVNSHIVLKLVHGKCIWRISQAIGLTPEQAEYLPVMPQRQCVYQSGVYPEPLLIEIPELYFDYVSEEEVEAHMKPILENLKYTPLDGNSSLDLGQGMTLFSQSQAGKSKQKPNQIWKKILKTVSENAPVSLREIYEACDINHFQGRKILTDMEKQDMLECCAVSFGSRGNPKTYVVLKSKGAEFIGVDYEAVKLKGKGDTAHVILQTLLAQAMKDSGKTVSIEYYANGKSVDIAEIREDKSIAYEIELAPAHPHVAENVRKDFEAGFSQVVVITKNKAGMEEARNQIIREIEWEKLSKVEYKLPKDFL
ncbi:MAG: ATP-binding protein [Candidatus Aminicenantes bacterium]|jgi:hypothetical protein